MTKKEKAKLLYEVKMLEERVLRNFYDCKNNPDDEKLKRAYENNLVRKVEAELIYYMMTGENY